ncbi:hypothetical protein Tco_1195139 [Tanacetum coccineum]
MFDIDYLTDSMNYIPVSLDNQSNPHAGTSEVTNSACTLQSPNANASEEADKDEELIVVPTAIKHSAAKVGPRKSSTNSKEEKFLTELQNLQTQEKEAFSIGISEDTPEILAFRRDLDQLAQKHLREVTTNKATNMPELTIFNKPQKGIFDEASYDEEGMVHDFNNLPTEVAVSPIPTLRIHNIHPQSQILGDPKSSVQTRSRVKQTSGAHMTVGLKLCKRSCLQFSSTGLDLWKRVYLMEQSDWKLNDEEVYVSQPPGFVDPNHAKKESKAYKTYLGYATGVVPPKMAQKFKKSSPSMIDNDLVPVDKEHVQKGKRVKRPAKKSTTKPAAGVVIREAPVETKSKSKEKENVDVTRGKGIKLLSKVSLTEEAQMKEVRKKSLRDFHKTHPSGSGTVAEKPPSVDKITPTVTSEGTGDKPGVPDVTEDDSTKSESESRGNDEDDNNNDQDLKEESKDDDQEEEEFVHTPSPTDDKDDDNLESENDDVIKGDKEIIQGEGADAKMIDAQ